MANTNQRVASSSAVINRIITITIGITIIITVVVVGVP